MSAEYERTLIGQILSRPSVIDDHAIIEDMFNAPDYRTIFRAVEQARNDFRKADLVSVSEVLTRTGRGELVATLAAIEYVSTANAGFYAEQLREAMRRRGLILALREGAEACKDKTKTTEEISDTLMGAITSSIQSVPEPETPTAHNIIIPYIATIEKRIDERRHGGLSFVAFGVSALDGIIKEIRAGEVVVIAGRPGAGKTALALQMVRHSAKVIGKASAFFSMEMRRDEVLDRLVAQSRVTTVSSLRGGYVKDEEVPHITQAANDLYTVPLSIYDGAQSLALIRSRIRREKAVNKLELACVDYLGLIDLGNSKTPRWERMGEVSRQLKLLALDLGVTIVEVVQLGREADGQEPTLGLLRDSGSIEQDADRVVLLHAKEARTEGEAERQVSAIVAKNRHGPCGRASLMFDGRHVLFSDEAPVHEAPRGPEKPVADPYMDGLVGESKSDPWAELGGGKSSKKQEAL